MRDLRINVLGIGLGRAWERGSRTGISVKEINIICILHVWIRHYLGSEKNLGMRLRSGVTPFERLKRIVHFQAFHLCLTLLLNRSPDIVHLL